MTLPPPALDDKGRLQDEGPLNHTEASSMTEKKHILITLIFIAIASCGRSTPNASHTDEAWNNVNDPLRLGSNYEYRLQQLPTGGVTAALPWTDSYWPSNQGGIALRWIARQNGFSYQTMTRDQVRRLTPAQLASLSPAEKFDILNGRYDFPLTQSERQRTAPGLPSWHGLCHGWAAAAINYQEPKSVIATSADGLSIPFGSSDVKALLSYFQGQAATGPTYVMGSRCDINLTWNPQASNLPQCRDVNAGAFHVITANFLGRWQKSYLADVTRDEQVWNQPVYQFATRINNYQQPSYGAAPGTVQEAVITTTIYYMVGINAQWQSTLNTSTQKFDSKTFTYTVELNGVGQIIGGQWLTVDRPDFLWLRPADNFSGYFTALGPLYNASIASSGIEFPRY